VRPAGRVGRPRVGAILAIMSSPRAHTYLLLGLAGAAVLAAILWALDVDRTLTLALPGVIATMAVLIEFVVIDSAG
jgi:hypothetical protein